MTSAWLSYLRVSSLAKLWILRAPATTRPLSLSDASSKVISHAIDSGLALQAQYTVDWAQTGFVKGRQMADNILEVSSSLSVWGDVEGNRDCGATVVDFKTASPSLAPSCFFWLLMVMGLPAYCA
eukprot:5180928-Pyramimonas_sp.AAC.1